MRFGRTGGAAWAFINKDGALEYRVKFDNNAVTELAIGEVILFCVRTKRRTKIDVLDLTENKQKRPLIINLFLPRPPLSSETCFYVTRARFRFSVWRFARVRPRSVRVGRADLGQRHRIDYGPGASGTAVRRGAEFVQWTVRVQRPIHLETRSRRP